MLTSFLRQREMAGKPGNRNDYMWQLALERDFGAKWLARFNDLNAELQAIIDNDPLPFRDTSTIAAKDFYDMLVIRKKVKQLFKFQEAKDYYFNVERNPALNQWNDLQVVTDKMNILKQWLDLPDQKKVNDGTHIITQHYWDIIRALTRNTYKDRYGHDVLHSASEHSHDIIFHDLLAAGADPNVIDKDQRTVLFKLTTFGYWRSRSVKLLIKAGVDPELKDCAGKTALDWVREDLARYNTTTRDAILNDGMNTINLLDAAIRAKHECAEQEALESLQQLNINADNAVENSPNESGISVNHFKPKSRTFFTK